MLAGLPAPYIHYISETIKDVGFYIIDVYSYLWVPNCIYFTGSFWHSLDSSFKSEIVLKKTQ